MKTYTITLSKNFPTTHPRKGEPTYFRSQVEQGLKLHTCRGNFDYWAKRIDQVNKGEAIINLRQWSGKPYNSPMEPPFKVLDKDSGIGYERLLIGKSGEVVVNDSKVFYYAKEVETFCNNDGLSGYDFGCWFPKLPFAGIIIHFTKFRYQP